MKLTTSGALRVSPSELKDADLCMRRYRYKYVMGYKFPTKIKPGLAMGSVLHKVLERALNGDQNPSQLFFDEWDKYQQANLHGWDLDPYLKGLPEATFKIRGARLAENIASYFVGHEIVETEAHLSYQIDKFYEIHGYVDLINKVDGQLHLGDWKFGTTKKSAADVLAFWYQFAGYKLMARAKYDVDPIVFMHTGSVSLAGKPRADFTFEPIPAILPYEKMEIELIDRFKYLSDHVMKASDRCNPPEDYPQTGRSNKVCGYCDFAGVCGGIVEESSLPRNPEVFMPADDSVTEVDDAEPED